MNQSQYQNFRARYGPWAVITGASSGIGRSCAEWLAAAGIDLVLVARREAELHKLAQEIERDHSRQVRVLAADLSENSDLIALEKSTASLDVGLLIAAAGFGTSGPLLESDLDEELNMHDVNCRAVLRQSHYFGRRLALRGRGGVVLFGSLLGFQGAPWAAHYAATKAYVQTFGEGLHVELAPRGVDVLVSAPGPVRSGFGERAHMRMGAAETPRRVARATLEALGSGMTVTPGLLSRILTWSIMTAPRSLRTRIMGKIMAGMTRTAEDAV